MATLNSANLHAANARNNGNKGELTYAGTGKGPAMQLVEADATVPF